LPKPPDRDFLNQMILVFDLTATTHLDKCKLTALCANGLLHQACGFPVLHRYKAGRADHVCETQLVLRFPGVAVVESEICPVDFKFFTPLGRRWRIWNAFSTCATTSDGKIVLMATVMPSSKERFVPRMRASFNL